MSAVTVPLRMSSAPELCVMELKLDSPAIVVEPPDAVKLDVLSTPPANSAVPALTVMAESVVTKDSKRTVPALSLVKACVKLKL